MTRRLALTALLCVLAGAAGVVLVASRFAAPARSGTPTFTETKWPFPMDQWGLGHAFRCGPEDCGTEVQVYIRAKIGF